MSISRFHSKTLTILADQLEKIREAIPDVIEVSATTGINGNILLRVTWDDHKAFNQVYTKEHITYPSLDSSVLLDHFINKAKVHRREKDGLLPNVWVDTDGKKYFKKRSNVGFGGWVHMSQEELDFWETQDDA